MCAFLFDGESEITNPFDKRAFDLSWNDEKNK